MKTRTMKLNTEAGATKIIKRYQQEGNLFELNFFGRDELFEKQYVYCCAACKLPIAYDQKGQYMYIINGSVNKIDGKSKKQQEANLNE